LLGLLSVGGTTLATPSTNDIWYATSLNTIGWFICHLEVSKWFLIAWTQLNNTSLLLNPRCVTIANFTCYVSIFLW
jgi:hypothetical protein